MSFKRYIKEASSIRPIGETYKDIVAFDEMLEELEPYYRGVIQSAAYADRLDRSESDRVSAAKNFLLNIKNIREHIGYLKKNMKQSYGRDIKD